MTSIFVAVVFPDETRAHVAEGSVGQLDGALSLAVTLCGEPILSDAHVGGIPDRYCQTCAARLGSRPISEHKFTRESALKGGGL